MDCENTKCVKYTSLVVGENTKCVSRDRVKELCANMSFESNLTQYTVMHVQQLTEYTYTDTDTGQNRSLTSYVIALKTVETRTIFIAFSIGQYDYYTEEYAMCNDYSKLIHIIKNLKLQENQRIILCGHSLGCSRALRFGLKLLEKQHFTNISIYGTGAPEMPYLRNPELLEEVRNKIILVVKTSEEDKTTYIDSYAQDYITSTSFPSLYCLHSKSWRVDKRVELLPIKKWRNTFGCYPVVANENLHEWGVYKDELLKPVSYTHLTLPTIYSV